MANSVAIQTLADGPRNTILKIVGVIDTADVANTDLIDPATLSSIIPGWPTNLKANNLAIKRINFDVEDGIDLRLYWGGTPDLLIQTCVGRGDFDYTQWGFLQNNASTPTGKIRYSTQGWAASQVLEFTITLWLIKQGSFG